MINNKLVSISDAKHKHHIINRKAGLCFCVHLFVFSLVCLHEETGHFDWAVSLLCRVTWHYVCLETGRCSKQLRSVLWKELCDGHQRETQSNKQATM